MPWHQCPKCSEWTTRLPHTCRPFLVIDAENTDASQREDPTLWRTVHAYDAEEAAERFAEEMQDGSGEGRDDCTVIVRDGDGGETVFRVAVEMKAVYRATEEEG